MIFSETKVTEIYRMADDFCKEIAQFRGKYMVEDKDIEYSMPRSINITLLSTPFLP